MSERMDIKRLKHWVGRYPDSELWIIAGKKDMAHIGARALKELGIENEIRVFSQSTNTIDGLKCSNVIIVLYDQWWKNPVADTSTFRYYMNNARYVMQIGEL